MGELCWFLWDVLSYTQRKVVVYLTVPYQHQKLFNVELGELSTMNCYVDEGIGRRLPEKTVLEVCCKKMRGN